MKPHQVRQMVNELRDVANLHCGTEQLRDRISHVAHKYLAVPQEWVGLTDEEITDLWAGVSTEHEEMSIWELGHAIEAELRKKNVYGWQSVADPTEYLDDLRGGKDE